MNVIFLRREGEAHWRAEVPSLLPSWQSKPAESLSVAIVEAWKEARTWNVHENLGLRVEEGTRLSRDDVLALIEANGGPAGLDLSGCQMSHLELSRHTILTERDDHQTTYASDPDLLSSGNPAWFSRTTQGLNLKGAQLERANLAYSRLIGADLRRCRLEGASLRRVEADEANFASAELQGASLREAKLNRGNLTSARLHKAKLFQAELKGAVLSQAELEGAYLMNANLEGANLSRANLAGADLRWARLGNVDLYTAASLSATQWYGAFLGQTRMYREQLGSAIGDELSGHRVHTSGAYRRAGNAYQQLKNNFLALGRYDDASWAHIKEQQMYKMSCFRQWQHFRSLASLARWLRSWAYELLVGYGERPIMPLLSGAALAAILFPLLYWATGALPDHAHAFSSSSPADIDWAGWGESLMFSLTSFATLSFTRLQPEGTIGNLIAAVEAMVGVLLFALFVFTLGNRMSRS